MKEDIAKGGDRNKDRRPFLASECKILPEAERWRREVIRDITKKVAEIQNAGLGEARIRDLNDEINKLIREKGHWEKQIKALGGPDYATSAPKMFDADGRELPGARGYKYFGAARDLPGIRELFADAARDAPKRTRGDIMKHVTPDYYGFRDEDDGVLLELEAKRTEELRAQLHAGWLQEQQSKRARASVDGAQVGSSAAASSTAPATGKPVALSEVEKLIAARKRALLLEKYASADLVAQQQASRDILTGSSSSSASGGQVGMAIVDDADS